MSSQNSSNSTRAQSAAPKQKRKRGFLRGLFLGGVLGAMLTAVVGAMAHFDGPSPGHFGAHEPGMLGERAEFAVSFMLKKLQATDAQQEQINAIVQTAIADLQPLISEHRSTKEAMREILEKPYVDRDALEALRVSTLEQADTVSQRMIQTLGDAADVLTQEQRMELLAHKGRHRH